jgi:hypothetical protein
MKGRELSCNYLLAVDAFRCNAVQVKSIRVLFSEQEMAILEQARALGFSSKAELLRCATLAWIDAATQRSPGDPPPRPSSTGVATRSASSSPNS